jgi:hypothetical protein
MPDDAPVTRQVWYLSFTGIYFSKNFNPKKIPKITVHAIPIAINNFFNMEGPLCTYTLGNILFTIIFFIPYHVAGAEGYQIF